MNIYQYIDINSIDNRICVITFLFTAYRNLNFTPVFSKVSTKYNIMSKSFYRCKYS